MKTLPACLAAALPLLTASSLIHADPRTDVIKGTTEGITIIGAKKTPPPPVAAASAASPAASATAVVAKPATPAVATSAGAASAPRTAGAPQWGDPAPGQSPSEGKRPATAPTAAVAPAPQAAPSPSTAKVSSTDPRLSVIRGTTDGIAIIGPKKGATAVGTAASGASRTSVAGPAAAEPAASSVSFADRLRGIVQANPPSGQTLPEVTGKMRSETGGIPLPTSPTPGGK